MNFQELADSYDSITCVLSIEKLSDGNYGDIRIVAGNKQYVYTIEHPILTIAGTSPEQQNIKFVPNSLYETYLTKEMSFEDTVYRAAILKEPIHTYIHPNQTNLWFNIFAMPLSYEEGNLCYCTYTMKLTDINSLTLSASSTSSVAEDVLKTCIKLHGTDDFMKTMSEVIKDTRICCNAEVCTIMLVDFSTGTCSILAKNVRENSRLKTVTQFVNFYDIANSWLKTMGDSDCLIIKNQRDMDYIRKVNFPWWLTLDEAGVDSVVMFPLRFNHEVLGFIWATNFETKDTLHIKETLELTTFFLSSQIASYKMMKRLEHMGYTDMLTGVQNRNAMNNRVTDIISGTEELNIPYGVIFADLNGLKEENDTHGHSAGDIMLKKAAILLQEIFEDNDIYRAGGDEFMVIIKGCTKEAFEEKTKALKHRTNMPGQVSFAVGSYYVTSGCDIRDAMRYADENMYKDKSNYYDEHPEKKKR